jgi:DNA ligase-1
MGLFQPLATLADHLATEPGRLKKRAAIAEAIALAYRQSTPPAGPPPDADSADAIPSDAGLFALYLAGLPFPEADARKLNAGGALLTRAVLTVTGASDAALTQAYRRHGDLGATTYDLLADAPARHPQLTLAEVSHAFAAIATAKTTPHRSAHLEDLLRRATPIEAKYLIKLMLGDMRIGVKQSLIEEAIAIAASTIRPDHPVDAAAVRHAVMLEADLARATDRAFAGTLDHARMRLFHPLGFMLASPVESPEEAVLRFTEKPPKPEKVRKSRKKDPETLPEPLSEVEQAVEEIEESEVPAKPGQPIHAFLEDKYDGIRAQIHCGDAAHPGRVAIYSRNREDITESFPELVEAFSAVKPDLDGGMILDGEILAWDYALSQLTQGPPPQPEATPRALPFAVLGTRIGRKIVTNDLRAQVPVVFMAFDLIFTRNELQLAVPLRDRRNRLEAIVEQMVARIVAPLAADPSRNSPQQAMFLGEEGAGLPRLMLSPTRLVESAEDIDRAYAEARARANEGVMLKAAASTYQPGRRGLAWVKLKRELATLDVVITGAEYGHGRRAAFLSDYTFAVRGPNGDLLNVGKAYSGVTDQEIADLTEFLKAHTLEDQGHFRLVEPLVVLEVAFNNIMRSDRHPSGFALRFPRIVRIRTDKPLEEIDTLARVEEVYLSQIDRPTG